MAKYLIAAMLACDFALAGISRADEPSSASDAPAVSKACIDGTGPGWRALTKDDLVNVNCGPDTWTWEGDVLHCTGVPTGVIRTQQQYTNFELVVQWKHLRAGGNSGVFVWGTKESIDALVPNKLPVGIEVQILDHGFADAYIKRTGKKDDLFFSTNGDVFPTGTAKMTPFEPTSPNGKRSFPRKNLSRGAGEWNHYYVRAINGEVRLWVNGEEVSGGTGCEPRSGYLCLESEGSPIVFQGLRIRELP
ncbi:MAG TPA: DUF1080 domain-containing protein [Pirellulales bacterium]|nr:DUF1080 domain-containing protein [Pirellulales bacterium]